MAGRENKREALKIETKDFSVDPDKLFKSSKMVMCCVNSKITSVITMLDSKLPYEECIKMLYDIRTASVMRIAEQFDKSYEEVLGDVCQYAEKVAESYQE